MIGTNLSHYKILEQLGEGGMGQVYLAEDTRLDRRIALKVLPAEMADKPDRLERFQREAKAVAALNHPNIVTIYSVEEADGVHFITMELVEGKGLESKVFSGGLPMPEFMEIAITLADALSAAHERGIIHRDLKPANIMLGREGRLRVLDFGLAKLQETSHPGNSELPTQAKGDLTEAGAIMGTVPYMAPEQLQGAAVDHRSDVFSLGVIFYELVSGERPFRGASQADLISSILRDRPREISEIRYDAPTDLGRIIQRCLEKEPRRRFQTSRDLYLELEELKRQAADSSKGKPAPSVAVLPFANMSPDKDQDYFCEGIAEELINGLGRIETLRVASRTSSFQFRGTNTDVREIGRNLGVSSILEGSVRKSGNHLRITAQLVNVADGYRLWSDRFDREMKDIFAIQDEISESIVKAMEVTLSPKERRALRNVATSDTEAYDYYLRGRKFFYQTSRKSHEFARQLYSRAIEIDPSYALAYAGIADCCSFLYMYSDSSEANLRQAEENSRKALELDPDLAESHASRGLALSLSKNFDEAAREFQRATELNPRLYEAYYFNGRNFAAQGKPESAAPLLEKASEVRPEDYQAPHFLAWAMDAMGVPFEELQAVRRRALARTEKHVQMNPDDSRALCLGAAQLLWAGRPDEANDWVRRAMESDPEEPMILYNVACFMAVSGKADEAVGYLEQAIDAGFGHWAWIDHDTDFDSVRELPRFQALLARR